MWTTWAWFTAALAGAELHHSGYDILPSWDHEPRFHDLHHERFNCNYGLLGVFDLLHGTDEYKPGHKRSVAAVFSGLLIRLGALAWRGKAECPTRKLSMCEEPISSR